MFNLRPACLFTATAVTLTPPLHAVAQATADGDAAAPSTQLSPEAVPKDEAARLLIDRWERLLNESKCATVKLRSQRTQINRDLSDETKAPELKFDIVVRAQAIMKADAHWLVVWEGEEGEKKDHEGPVLTVQFAQGMIRERLWYPALKQYDTKRYPAPTKAGANDTKYENGCQIGSLLQTWLGGTNQMEMLTDRMRDGELLPDQESIAGQECFVFRIARPLHKDADGSTYQTVHSYFLNKMGHLRRWTTVATTTQGQKQAQVTQTRDYDFEFFEEIPPELGIPTGNPFGSDDLFVEPKTPDRSKP